MKRFCIVLLSILLLVSLMLPILASCSKDKSKDENPTVADDGGAAVEENAANEGNGDGGESAAGKAEKEEIPEPIAETTEDPIAKLPAGSVIIKYDFANGLQGIVTNESNANDDDSIEIIDIEGVKALRLGHQFGGGWELAMFDFPSSDVPAISQASKIKWDMYIPASDVKKLSWTDMSIARRTDWGKWWEGWAKNLAAIKKEEIVGDYYKFVFETDFIIESNGTQCLITESDVDTWELSLGLVCNGFQNYGDLRACIANIEFIK